MVEPREVDHWKTGDEPVRLGGADREKYDDGVGRQSPAGEDDRLGRRQVEEVQVVDHDGDRLLLGVPGEQTQHRGSDHEPVPAPRSIPIPVA